MISRIRIEAQGYDSAHVALELQQAYSHFSLACYLEGLVPQESRVTEEVIEQKNRTVGKGAGSMDVPYVEGRRIVKWDVEPLSPIAGGLALYGHRAYDLRAWLPGEAHPILPEGEKNWGGFDPDLETATEITDDAIVLRRFNPVTRQHSWELG